MPVAKGPTFDLRSAAIFGGLAVLAAVVIGFVAITLGMRSNTLVLGSTDFGDINANRMAESILDGGPILFSDIASGSRDIWLQHLGDTPGEGWFAFDTRLPGEERECAAQWMPADRIFVNPCNGTTYPDSGEGLPQIPVFIDETTLIIDINGIHEPGDFVGYTG